MKKWIWEDHRYPDFPYNANNLIDSIDAASQKAGQLHALISILDRGKESSIAIDTITEEIIANSAIEGEQLSYESVRSSVRKRLDADFDLSQDRSTHHTDALTSLLLDSTSNHEPIHLERLHKWHAALFAGGFSSSLHKISVGSFRTYDDMEVVSGVIGKEKVHYLALPADRIKEDVDKLLTYINTSSDNVYIKSAIAHLWFVTIHPYDDGNGRIARIIADYILSKESPKSIKYFSISSAIQLDKKGYYDTLEHTQNLLYNQGYDFTEWIRWHTEILAKSMEIGLTKVEIVVQKARFWNRVDAEKLNSRQIKVLNKLLEYPKGEFEGGLSTKKYMSMTKTSKPTAVRDIQKLVALGYLQQIEGTAGRNVKYELVLE